MIPLVLLHFFGSSRREWSEVRTRLPANTALLTLDLPGFGDAARLAPRDAARMADFVDAFIADAGLDACAIVGHSMSAKVAALLAARRHSYLQGLVLVTASPPSPEPMTDAARHDLLAFDHGRAAAEHYIDGITATRLPDVAREIAVGDAMRASPEAWHRWVAEGSQQDCSTAVGRVVLPTLVIAGAGDPSLGADIQRTHVMPHFPHASLVTIAGGHVLPLENARDLSHALEAFATRLESHACL